MDVPNEFDRELELELHRWLDPLVAAPIPLRTVPARRGWMPKRCVTQYSSSLGVWMKSATVLFGQHIPETVLARAKAWAETCDLFLVVGSSLMVYSGFRFVQTAAGAGKPVAAINLGRTRADELLALKVEQECEAALAFLL